MPPESFDLRLVAPFVAVADSPTYAAAAVALGMPPATLTERIGRLERQLGARLVDQDGRRVGLTPAGERFLVEARTILRRAGQVAAALRAEPGTVRVNLGDAAVIGELRDAVGRFCTERQDVHVEVSSGTGTEAAEALRRGHVDVAFDYPLDAPPGTSYTAWTRAPFLLVCAPTHPLAGRGSAAWSDLGGEAVFVAPPGIADAYNATLRAMFSRVGVRVREVVGPPVADGRYLVPTILRGDAVLAVPEWWYPTLPPGLPRVRVFPEQEAEVGAHWDASTASPVVRSFVAMLQSVAPVTSTGAVGTTLLDAG